MDRDIPRGSFTRKWAFKNAFIAWLVGALYAIYFSVPASFALSVIYFFKPPYARWHEYFYQVKTLFSQPISDTLVYLGQVVLVTSPIFIFLLIVGRFFAKFILRYFVGLPAIVLGVLYVASVIFSLEQSNLPMIIQLEGFFGVKAQWEILTNSVLLSLSPLLVSSIVFVFLMRKAYNSNENNIGDIH